jgi:hypothetical protein
MAMEFWAYDGTQWREASEVWAYDGTQWREADEVWCYDGGTWRQVFQAVTSCDSGHSLTSATSGLVGGVCGSTDCQTYGGWRVTWVTDGACAGEHMELALSIGGGGYSEKCDNAAACDDCADSPYTWYSSNTSEHDTTEAGCERWCDPTGCYGATRQWRVRRHDDVGEVQCAEVFSDSPTLWDCACEDCDGVE